MEQQFKMLDSTAPQTATVTFSREVLIDETPDISYLQQDWGTEATMTPQEARRATEQDSARLCAFYRGDWHMVGIRAKADIMVPAGGNSFAMYTLTSPGVWGVESDSDESYFAEIYRDEMNSLKAHMCDMATAFQAMRDSD